MIVDTHTHLWDSPDQLGPAAARSIRAGTQEPWSKPEASLDAFDVAMDPVDCAFILGFESETLGASIPHERVAAYAERRPGKYLGFAGVDPMARDYLGSVRRAMDLGLVGVTVSPAAQGFHPSHTRAMELYAKCEELGLPIIVHAGTHLGSPTMLENSQPYLFDEVARTFPELRMVIGQVGHPWVEQTLALVSKHEHLYTDLSDLTRRPWQLYHALVAAHEYAVMDRLLFGSDFPFVAPEDAIITVYSINTFTLGTHLPSVPREQLRGIIERDALACLGLDRPHAMGASSDPEPADADLSGTDCITITAVSPDGIRPSRVARPGDGSRSGDSDEHDGAGRQLTGVSDQGGETAS